VRHEPAGASSGLSAGRGDIHAQLVPERKGACNGTPKPVARIRKQVVANS